MINGKTQIYGIFGYPIAHTQSPAMQNAAFAACKLNAAYLPFEVAPFELERALRSLVALGLRGINVTVPHKEKVLPFLDELTKEAQEIGAVNTIRVDGGKLTGHNTDGLGFLRAFNEAFRLSPKGRSALILGAGGAARAVAFALKNAGCRNIELTDIVSERSERLASDVGARAVALRDVDLACAGAQILINATPVGMKPSKIAKIGTDTYLRRAEETSIKIGVCPYFPKPASLHKGLAVFDLVYSPSATRLVRAAKAKGLKATGGLGMLLYQGALAFEFWTHRKPPIEAMRRALKSVSRPSHRLGAPQ